RLAQGEVGLQVFVAFVSTNFPVGRAFREAMKLLDLLDDACARYPQHLRKCVKAEEIERAAAEGRIAVVPALENGHAIESDLKKLETLAARGIRYMTLTHSVHLPWAASSGDNGEGPGGLTAFPGRARGRLARAREDLLGRSAQGTEARDRLSLLRHQALPLQPQPDRRP